MTFLFFLSFLVISVSLIRGGSQCDKDWIYNEDYCYWSSYNLLAKNESVLANWFGAQLYCQELGGNLAHFSNSFEMNLISMLVACSSSWLGLIYKHTPYTKGWVWWGTCNDASHLVNKSEVPCGSHQAIAARLDPKGIIVGDFLDTKLPFVCKKDANEVDDNCDHSTTEHDVSTMHTSSNPTLTPFFDTTTEDASSDYPGGDFSGHQKDDLVSSTSGDPETSTDATEPATDVTEQTNRTITVKPIPTTAAKRPCNRTCSTGFVDEDSPCCPKALRKGKTKRFYDENTSKCYYLQSETQTSVDYFAAQLTCQEQNMHLSSIHSAEENQIVGFLSMCKNTWIGLENVKPQDVCNCHGWAWEDYSSAFKNHTLCEDFHHNFFKHNLIPNAPICVSSAQCAYIYPQMVQQRNQYYWKNCNCYELLNFICVE